LRFVFPLLNTGGKKREFIPELSLALVVQMSREIPPLDAVLALIIEVRRELYGIAGANLPPLPCRCRKTEQKETSTGEIP
jgi:hypothetical protein